MNENKNKYREVKLAQALNGFMYNFGLEDFYSKLSIDKILQLKQILSDINNIITLRLTRLFVDFLLHEGIIDKYALKHNRSMFFEIPPCVGIGSVGFFARIGARPEVTVITLKKP